MRLRRLARTNFAVGLGQLDGGFQSSVESQLIGLADDVRCLL